jgi:class 3 adenylate cyclase
MRSASLECDSWRELSPCLSGLAIYMTPSENGDTHPNECGPAMVQKAPPLTHNPEWVVRTLLFMDVVESVRLMEENENDVVRRWRQLVGVVEDILPARHGRLVKSLGDGLMLEFPSVKPAVKAGLPFNVLAPASIQVCRRSSTSYCVWAHTWVSSLPTTTMFTAAG